MSFNQGIPGPATLINSSSTLLYGNTSSGNALSVQQLGAGNVATFRTTTGATALFINPSGYVGVGTTNPQTTLQVSGPANTATNRATPYANAFVSVINDIIYGTTSQVGLEIGSGTRASGDNDRVYKYVFNAINNATFGAGVDFQILAIPTAPASYASDGTARNRMTIRYDGNVGIGTTNPGATLDVMGSNTISTPTYVFLRNGGGGQNSTGSDLVATQIAIGNPSYGPWIRAVQGNGYYTDGLRLDFCTNITNNDTTPVPRLTILGQSGAAGSARIGIGTTSPGYTLDVNTSSSGVGWTGYMWYNNSTGNPATSGTDIIAVNANGAYRTTSGGFLKVSDARIKKNIQPISSVIDTVLQLKPCTFQYIDEARLGTQTINGFIAQEVEKVLPGVVNKTGTGYVPDVYRKGGVQGTTITLEAPLRSANLAGQKIQVYYSDTSNTEVSVEANVMNFTDSTITLDTEIPSQTCFVYGTYTSAMYSVANESMVPTLVAAIQELSAENTALKTQLAAMDARLAALEAKLNSQ